MHEAAKFQDILQVDFEDDYQNLTLKTITGMQWVESFCNCSKLYIKMDDDVYFYGHNLDKLQSILTKYNSYDNSMACARSVLHKNARRNPNSTWHVSERDYPFKTYPPFCAGYGYAMTLEIVHRILQMAYQTRFFWIDDVFIGIVAQRASVGLIPIQQLYHRIYFFLNHRDTPDKRNQRFTEFWHRHYQAYMKKLNNK